MSSYPPSPLPPPPLPPNCILLMHSSTKRTNTTILCTTNTQFYNSSINIGFLSFFSSFGMHQSHHLLGCHAVGMILRLTLFKILCIFQIYYAWQKSCSDWRKNQNDLLDKKAVLTREKNYNNLLDKKAVLAREKIKKQFAWQKKMSWLN